MEPENMKGRDPFLPATHEFNEASDAAPSIKPNGGIQFITPSNISEEQVAQKEEEAYFSQDLSLLFVVEEQIWGTLSNSFEKETSVGLQRGQRDPEECTGPLERERDLIIQESSLEDSRDPSLNCHDRKLTVAYSSNTDPISLSNTLAQIPSVPGEGLVGQVETQAFAEFPQALNSCDALSQMLCEKSFPVSKCHQHAETFKVRSDEDHSLEAQYETDKEVVKGLEAMWGMDEMSSKTEKSGQIDPSPSRKFKGGNERELTIQRECVKSYLPYQPSSGGSEDRSVEMTQVKPDGPLSLVSPDQSDINKKALGQNSFICTTLHLQEDEEDGAEDSLTHSLKETIQIKHVKSNEKLNEEEEDLDGGEIEHKIKTKDKLKLRHSDVQEEQEWDKQVRKISRKGEQRDEMAISPDMLGLNTVYNLKNKLTLPVLNQSNTLTGSTFTFNVFSSDCCPVNANPGIQTQICHEFKGLELSGIYHQTAYEQSTEGNKKVSLTKEISENVGDEKNTWNTDGEDMAVPCRDLSVMPNSKDQHNCTPRDCTVDVDLHVCTSLLGNTTAADPLQKGTDKEVNYGNFMLCEETDSIEEPANKKLPISQQVDPVACGEAITVDNGTAVQTSSKNGTCNKDFHKCTQGSTCKICQSVSPEASLSNTTKEHVELSHVTSLTMQDLLSIQEDDSAMSYLEEHQPIESSMKKFEFLGKEIGADTFCIKQQVSINEPSYLSVLDENRTEVDHNTDIPAFPTTGFMISTDVAQLKEPWAPVPVSDQCLVLEPASSHLSQILSPLCCSQAIQLLTPPDNINAFAQLNAPVLHARCISHFLKQVPSCRHACPFLAVESTAIKEKKSDTELFDQSPDSQYDLNQYSQPPDPVPRSDQYNNNQPISTSIILQKPTAHCVFPEHKGSQSIQEDDFIQVKEYAAPRLNNSHPTEHPDFAADRDSYKPPQASTSNRTPTPAGNEFVQQPVEIPEPNVPRNHTEGNSCIHTSVPINDFASQTPHSDFQSENFAQIQYVDSRVKESSVLQLDTLEGRSVLQDQKDWNIPETGSDLGVNVLSTDSDVNIFGNYTSSVDSIAKMMSQAMDMHDAKSSFDHTYHLSLDSQKKCEATEFRNPRQPPPLLAFTNPIHFLQLGPPSPPTRDPSNPQADSQGPQWQQEQTGYAKTATSVLKGQLAEDNGKFRKSLEKSAMEPIYAVVQKTDRVAKHPVLEKSSSCPDRNVIVLGPNLKKQDVLTKHRAKSKDWHRHGMRKISIPTENELEIIASLVPSKEDDHAYKNQTDKIKYGEKKPARTVENIKRRRSKLINSSKVLYQEYSDVVLNKAIQNQKRADFLSEDVELESPSSPRLQRKVLPTQDSYLQRLSVSSSTSLWQDIPKVRESTMLLSMTREEQKLQEAKFELIASEASYLRSLNIAVDHFQHSQELQAVLTNQDKQWLFSRLQDVRDVSANFLFDLEEELEENMFNFNVCDVALRHASEFRRVYLPYVTNQTYQEQTFQRLLNGVPAFQQVLGRLESDPVCQRLSLKSFLILPFQRITRLKLLLQNILKRIQPGADEEVQATQAYDALEKLIKDCNENVQRMKSTEELIYLSKNMEFECKIFPLISQSRRLVKCGELTALEYNLNVKWKLTTRSIYLHLFNDCLLLSRPKENGRFIVFDYAASSDVRGEKCEMKLHGSNKNLFRLFLLQNNQGKKVEFLFRTETQSEKLRWISALMPQQTELDLLDDADAPQVHCVKSYKPRENDELALEKADIIMVLRQSTDGWTEGVKLSDGERGWFPTDQVEVISSKQVRQMNLKEEQRVKNAKQQIFHRK